MAEEKSPFRDLVIVPTYPQVRLVFHPDGTARLYGDLNEVRSWCRRTFRDVTSGVLPGDGNFIQIDRQGRTS